MGLLLLLLVLLLLIYLSGKSKEQAAQAGKPEFASEIERRDYRWAEFIASYYTAAKDKAQRELVRRMLADIAATGAKVPDLDGHTPVQPAAVSGGTMDLEPQSGRQEQAHVARPAALSTASGPAAAPPVELDNATLLLYFGAFLFVASAGLFVAFSGVSGGLRTTTVLLVSLSLYYGGLWLHGNRPKLRQAAYTFAGIGMAVAPLTGVAAYNYIFDSGYGPVIWLTTSVLCLALYAHAYSVLRNTLMGYVLIFTILSLFESGISVLQAPVYYYGWAMALMGLGLRWFAGRQPGRQSRGDRTSDVHLQESATNGAALFLPVALFASLIMTPDQGTAQLGVSLLIAAVYYFQEALRSMGNNRSLYALVAQVAAVTGIAAVSYGLTDSLPATGLAVMAATAVQVAAIMAYGNTELWRNFASVAIGMQVVAAVVLLETPAMTVWSLVAAIAASVVTWRRQGRADAYTVAAFSWMALPLVYGLLVARPRLDGAALVGLALCALCIQFAVLLSAFSRAEDVNADTGRQVYLVSALVPVVASFWGPPWWCFAACAVVSASMFYLAYEQKVTDWVQVGGLVVAAPLLQTLYNFEPARPTFLMVTLVAVGYNLAAALRYRAEANRWLFAGLWLVLPLAMAGSALGPWQAAHYAWAYLVAGVGLLFARAVARGAVFPSSRVPLASYARSASLSYVSGYGVAWLLSLVLGLQATNSHVHLSLLLAIVTVLLIVVSRVVEKRADILTLVPLLLQVLLWSLMRPVNAGADMVPFLLSSAGTAVLMYATAYLWADGNDEQDALRNGALFASFVAPVSVLFTGVTYWPMPWGLLVASVLLYDRVKSTSQASREWVGALALLAVYWLLWFAGVRELQAYVHALVALLAGYAYWRRARGDEAASDQYLAAMFACATVPLALQALSGAAGGLYGWWLLLEQIGFILLGMIVGKRFLTMWGLYVAVAAVLYQLRHLGWAALTVLALFLIGLAVYQLQKKDSRPLGPPPGRAK